VNRAAHLARLAPPGRVLVSRYMLDQLVDLSDFVARPSRCGLCLDIYEMERQSYRI
jgi:class 3 adenylate cyclase